MELAALVDLYFFDPAASALPPTRSARCQTRRERRTMLGMYSNKSLSPMTLPARCRAASLAYDTAGRALDTGQRRAGGATPSEWKAEHDALVDLRTARAAYLADSTDFTKISAAYRLSAVARS